MKKNNLIPAPIDNKNVLEDFTFDFHSDLYIGTIFDHVIQQVFFMQGCLCEITYRFNQNWFKFRIIEGDPFDVRRCNAHKDYLIQNMNGGNVIVKLNPTLGAYEFFFTAD